jgi:hypothetical protein
MKKLLFSAVICVGLVLGHGAAYAASDFTSNARAVFEKQKETVVTVQIVIKSTVNMNGRQQSNESRQDVTGTVIDPSGLVVMSLSVTDPGQFMQNLMGEDNNRLKVETEITDMKYLLPDGTEVPAEIVLRDRDLDLAFARPKAKLASPLVALDLSNSGKADVLDEVISINRLGRAAGRSYAASVERISAVMQRPRFLYVPMGGVTTTALGSPALLADGKVLGIFLVRGTRDADSASSGLGSQPGNVTAVIIPAEQVQKAASQAPQAGAAAAAGASESKTNEPAASTGDEKK